MILKNTERDQSAEIAAKRKENTYGGIKNHNAKIFFLTNFKETYSAVRERCKSKGIPHSICMKKEL